MFPLISARVKLQQAKRREIRAKIHRTLIVALIAPLFVTISAPPSLGLPSIPTSSSTPSNPEVEFPFTDPVALKTSTPITQSANLNSTGLVARFDAKTYASYSGSGTTWSDISGNGLSAAFTNKTSPLTSDYTSGGVTFKGIGFNGTDQYAAINSTLNATYSSGISISFFANFGSVANNYERIIDIGNGPSNENILIAREATTSNLIAEVYSGTGSVGWCRVLSAIPATAIWAHYAFVFNGTTCSLYKDGALYTSGAIQRVQGTVLATSNTGTVSFTGLPASGAVSRPNAWIGRSNWSGDSYFEGAIADLAIFNRALTATDVGEWKVDQMSSTVHAGSGVCANRVANPAAVTVTSVGGDCVVKFTAPSNTTTANTWIVPSGVTRAKVLTVAGGGGGGAHVGGGGGAGGFIESTTVLSSTTAISISVGAGGTGTSYPNAVYVAGTAGSNSVFGSSFTALGGGLGASWITVPNTTGGSGGGSTSYGGWYGTGSASSNSAQGNAGGSSLAGCQYDYGYPTGGGGGAGAPGASATCLTNSTGKSGDGGIGKISDVTGTPTYYAGGGGGGLHGGGTYLGILGNGGLGGGGKGNGNGRVTAPGTYLGADGTDGLGGGGGGSGAPGQNTYTSTGGRGGSGVVIIRYGTTTLSMNSNGGSGFTGTTSFTGTTFTNITLPAQSGLSRSGFTFGGWNTSADGSGINYAASSAYQFNITTTLYAQWRSVILYDANGGISTRPIESTTALGSSATTLLSSGRMDNGTIVSKDSSTLSGWSTTTDSSTSVIVGNNGTLLAGLPTPYIRLEAKNYDGTTWTPTNYNGNGLTYSEIKPSKNNNQTGWGAAATFPTVSGLAADKITVYLNNPVLDSYTLCGMARYKPNGIAAPTMGRIFTGTSVDWLAGWYNSNTKDFYHQGYLNNSTTFDYNWHYLCDSGNNVYWDGVKLPVVNQTYTKLPTLALGGAINNTEWSDFEITEVIVYDQFLSASQIAQVNQYFKSTYGMVAGAVETATPNMVPPTNFASTGTSTLYARWGSTITYDGNGQSSGTPPAPQVFANGVGTLATNSGSLAKAGYNFAGWNTRADGSGTLYAAGSSYSGSNLLLYAIYQVPVKFTNTLAAAEPITLSPYMRFRASDYDAAKKIWYDSSGNGLNTSYVRGDPIVATTTVGNGSTRTFTTVQGGLADGIQFKNKKMSTNGWTMFSVARYNGTQTGNSRLFEGETDNFIFGFYQNRSGVAHYNGGGWLPTNGVITPDSFGQNWVISSGFTDTYRGNGYAGTASNPLVRISRDVGDVFPSMAINAGEYIATEKSTWQVAETIIFDRKLSISEIEKVEDYLATTYGIQNYVRQSTYSESVTVNAAAGVVTLTDTYMAVLGYRNVFTISPTIPGITMENTATNSVRVRVASTVAAGTYWETITVTDAIGNTALLPIKINVFPQVVWSPSNSTSAQTTYGKQARIRLDFTDGGTNKRVTLTHVSNPSSAAITIDTSTISSGFVTVLVDTSTIIGSYQESVTITDSTGVIKSTVLSITVNKQATIAYPTASSVPSISRNGLIVRYEMDSATSYSGTGTTITDLQGRSNGIINGSTTYSRDFNGNIPLTGTQYIHMATGLNSATIGETISVFMWVQPTNNGVLLDERGQVGANGVVANGWQITHLEVVSNVFKIRTYNGTTISYTPPGGTAINSGWYYVGYVYNKSTLTFTAYVNGVAVGTVTAFDRQAPFEYSYPQFFGIGLTDTSNMGNGANGSFKFGAFHLYNTALSSTDVLNNYLVSKGRYTYLPSAGALTLTTTAGINKDFSIFTGLDGVGNKSFAISGVNSNFGLETSTTNVATFKVLSSTTAASASAAKTYNETLTATDTNGLITSYSLIVTANPVLLITTTTETITTTFGRTGSTTLNVAANTGTGSSTFSRVSSSGSSAITATLSTGQAILNVAGTLPAGTYYETLTATDSLGATAFKVITIVVNAAMAIVPATGSTTFETTFTRATTARLNITGGTGNRTYAITYPSSTSRWRITLDTSTAASNFVTVKVDSFTATGTHSISVTVTDSQSATASTTLTLVVNDYPILNNVKNENSYIKPGLVLNLDAANRLSSTGTGNWKDLSGAGSSATFTVAPTYSTANGGIFTFDGVDDYLTFPSISTANSPGVTNGVFPEYTAESWVRFNYSSFSSFTGTACLICEAYTGSPGSVNLALSIKGNGQIQSGYYPSDTTNWVETTTAAGTVATGIWYHIAATVVRSGLNYINTIYVNGVAITSKSSTQAPATSSRNYYIGRRWDSPTQLLNGSIGVVRVYNRGLSQSEIQDNYNALASRYINTALRSSTFTTTQGASYAASSIPATLGTGNKTLTLTPVISGITGDTSTANGIRVTAASTLAATDTQTARTYVETITATDIAGASVTHLVNVTVNPPIILSAGSTSIATTSGIETSTVITATKGSSTVTFTRTGTSTSGITLTAVGNQATLRVLSTINPGTYYETVTATDTATATTSIMFTIVVAPPPSMLGTSRLESSKGALFKSPIYAISGGTGTLTMTVTNSPSNANISLTGVTSAGGYLQVAAASETGTYTSTIRVTDGKGAYSEIAVTVIVNAPVTLSGSLSITKTYGNSTTNGYSTNGTGTAPFSFSSTPVCAVVKTVSGSYTYEQINGTDSCTWTAPVGVTAVDALLVGGGGGGGADGGGGGGGGSINNLSSIPLPANRQLTVQIGAGGTGGIHEGNSATTGGATSITGSNSYSAPGGYGGAGCGSAATAGAPAGTDGTASAGGNGGYGATGSSCNTGTGGVGTNGPTTDFMGTGNVSFGGGGGGGPYPGSTESIGGKLGGTGGGGTGATSKGNGGNGLSQYFRTLDTTPPSAINNPAFISGTCAVRTGNIDYANDDSFPCSQKNNFQVYASGFFIAPVGGTITFHVVSDDSSVFEITVNDTVHRLERTTSSSSYTSITVDNFTAGQSYPVNAHFTEIGGLAEWRLAYSHSTFGQTIIPSSQLRPADEGLAQYFKTYSSTLTAAQRHADQKTEITGSTCRERIGNINYANKTQFRCVSATADYFQGYATGYFKAPYTGRIKFFLSSDDSSHFSIDINGTIREFGTSIGSVSSPDNDDWLFVKGQYYPVKVYFTEITGGASWTLDYEYDNRGRTTIPASAFRPTADFTLATAGTNGRGGGGGAGSAGFYITSGARGGSGTAIIKYLTQSESATASMITAVVETSTPSGLLTLRVPEFVTVGTYYETITVQDSVNSAPYTAVVKIKVNQATPTTTITLPGGVTTAKYGTPVTLSVTASTPGDVNFKKSGTSISGCSLVPTVNGIATCSWTPSAVETASISALLSPTDSINYSNSVETASAISVLVGKADTLTITANTPSAITYSSPITLPTNGYTTSGLRAIDSITAMSYSYSLISGGSCANGGVCSVGDIGPAGGVVFYVSPTVINAATGISSGGTYLEAAPSSTLTTYNWCNNTSTFLNANASAIGDGAETTRIIAAACTSGAAKTVANLTQAGYSDWFLPSFAEIIEMSKLYSQIGMSTSVYYWASSEYIANFGYGHAVRSSTPGGALKTDSLPIWPIRAFSSGVMTSPPSDAGTYYIYPATPTFNPGATSNYTYIDYQPGTLVINKAPRSTWSATYNAGTNTTRYGVGKTETATVTYPGDGSKLFGTSSSVCTVETATGTITTTGVGSCALEVSLSETKNWLPDTQTVTVTIDRGLRTASVSPAKTTIKYGETSTVASTISPALDSATVIFSVGTFLGCSADNVTGDVTGIKAGASCAVSVTYGQTDLYESATASAAMTINKALAPVVTTETITAVSYTGNTALVTPTYRVSGVLARDILQITPSADVSDISLLDPTTYSTVASYKYFATTPTAYDSTTAPSQGGTYAVTPQTLTLLNGVDISNYETPNYVSANLVIEPIAQTALRILLSAQDSITVPYDITFAGGSSTGSISAVIISGGTATGCSISALRLSTSSPGTCILQATKLGDRNYLDVISETATVTILNFVSYTDWNAVFNSGSGITITSQVPITVGPDTCDQDCQPQISDVQDASGNATTTLTVGAPLRIVGVDLNTTERVLFTARINGVRMSSVPADSFQVDSPTQLTVMPPAAFVPNTGENSSTITVRIIVISPGGSVNTEKIVIISL